MMREYKRYDEYKDSGIKIIGNIPRGWNLNKIKYNNVINPNKSELSYKEIDVSFIPMEYIKDGFIENKDIKNIDEVYNGYTYFKEGDILLAKVTPCFENGNLGIAKNLKNGIGFGTTEVHVIRAKKDNKKFIYYLFQNKHFKEKGNSEMYGAGGLKRISSDFVENYIYPRPDYQTQICISNYLDKKTAEIDEVINKKEKLIDYLEKYKKSVITEAVTKGKLGNKYINEDGELVDEIAMKDSGVEWIGEIPRYSKIIRLRYLVSISTGDKDTVDNEPTGKYPFFVRSDTVERINSFSYDGEAILTAGDGVGVGKVFHYYNGKFDYHQRVYKFSDFQDIDGRYLYYYLKNNLYKEILMKSAKTTVDSIRLPMLQNFNVVKLNQLAEKIIVNYVDKKTSQIDNLIKKTKESIEKYKEYKKSLIFEAVTGKIDLRDYELEGGEKFAEHNNSSETERKCLSAVD